MGTQPKPSHRRLGVGITVALALIGLLMVILDWRNAHKVLGQTDWKLVPAAMAFTALSFTCLSLNFAIANRIFGAHMSWRDLSAIGFVSTVLNDLLSAGGAAGYSVRFLFMREHGVTFSNMMAASLFDSYLDTLGMLALLPIGLGYLFVRHPLSSGGTAAVGITAVLVVVLLFLATVLILVRPLRSGLLRRLGQVARWLTHRDVSATLADLDDALSRGVSAARTRPRLVALMVTMVIIDWSASATTLWFCFDALGDPISWGVLLTGFSLGVTAGVLSMVPGGLGVQEGSMAGIFALLGVPLQQAVLAAILFRVVYYLLPYLVSLGFYWRLLRRLGHATPQADVAEE